MKKKLLAFIVACMMCLSLIGCTATHNTENHDTLFDQFVVIDKVTDFEYGSFYVTYDKDTMVEYYIILSGHRAGISPVYNADGTLKFYPEKLTD